MSYTVALDGARRNKRNRELQVARRNQRKENIKGLIKMSKNSKTLAKRFTDKTETEIIRSIEKVRDLYSQESKRRWIYFITTITILSVIIIILM